jgi:hypothetical protein
MEPVIQVVPETRAELEACERAFNQAFLGFKLDFSARDSRDAMMIRVCPWCDTPHGAPAVRAWAQSSGTRVTDGICKIHYAEQMAKLKVS